MCNDSEIARGTGLFFTFITLVIGFAVLGLTGVEYQTIYATWSESPYKALGPTQITAGCILLVTGFSGLAAFSTKKACRICHALFLVISMLFCYAIGIFAVVGAAMKGRVWDAVGCDTKSTGLLNIYSNIDEYFILAHSLMCSPLCPCKLSRSLENKIEYDRFAIQYLDEFKNLSKLGDKFDDHKEFTINDCPEAAKVQIMKMYESNPNNLMRDIDFDKFKKYWKKIEDRFECTGWCTTKYTNVFTLKEQHMYKYVFSDINYDVVKFPGCLNRVISWLHLFTSINAGFLLLSAFLQTINLILLFGLIGKEQK